MSVIKGRGPLVVLVTSVVLRNGDFTFHGLSEKDCMNSANLLMRLKTEKPVYSIRLNGVNCGARYCVTRPDREGEDARARTQHLRVFHKHGLYHSAEHCKTVLSFQIIFVHFLFPVQNIALLCSIYTTVVLAVQRYLAISKPLEYYIDGATSAAGERASLSSNNQRPETDKG